MTSIDSQTITTPTAQELVARVNDLLPLLKRNAAQGEQDRRVTEESIQALTDAGIFKLAVPKRYGGYEADMRTMLDVFKAVGTADGGTSWVVTLTNVCAWFTSLFPVQAQDEVFGADPDAKVSGVLAPSSTAEKVEGGFRVSGRWYYNSGSWHATWAAVGMPIVDADGNVVDQGLALIPAQDFRVEETWFVAGMKSSGSNCLIAEDIFIPDHRILSVPAALEGNYPSEMLESEPNYRGAFGPVAGLVLAGPQLGLGQAALDLVIEKSSKKAISYTFFEKQSDSVAFQLQIAEAAMLLDTANLHAYRAADDISAAALRGEYPDYVARARIKADIGWTIDHVTRAIDILLSAHGAGSFADVSPLQRIWRDSATGARHAVILPAVGYEVYGKALLGVEERITPIV
ncbi:acyl-CoA dehydrogenase family protein [Arthrobacter sp. GMC3]|uniref:acyl-CoA dehydrogenase family protein n=1 Tax=Arthrobacter sp. GMC3 TaxID=2058894 RepID=UPI000CE31CBC|nr:acyl-CoA dehydrogenase family protein [Arthrobacter sp. GMC3]